MRLGYVWGEVPHLSLLYFIGRQNATSKREIVYVLSVTEFFRFPEHYKTIKNLEL